MRKTLLLLCIPFVGIAQADYELEFNSATQDYVEITNVSSVIVNSTTFSMSAWVYPQANATHSGIMGFRNNVDTDFYLLQLQNTNNIEARFRNSSGLNYDIVASNILDFGQWQHLAFTYDGSNIHLYKDGVLISSTPANGVITQSAQSFRLAGLDYQNDVFHMNGRLDEVRLWGVALSQTEINSWMCTSIDLTHPNYNNLMGYWRLNDGQGTIAYDQTANGNNGMLMGGTQWQISTTCFGSTTPQLTYVPDDNFENYLEANGMGDGIVLNDNVFTSAIDTVTYLDVSNQNISDLTGFEAFTVLTYLNCEGNQLSILDVSQNTALTYLNCEDNQLTNLDLSNNTALIESKCQGNQITSLDLSQNSALTTLNCRSNQLTSLDVSQNSALTTLNCRSNQLTSLDVSQNSALTSLDCYGNQFISLDVSQNTALQYLDCYFNQLTSLDVSQNTALIELNCYSNQLTSLDVSNNFALTDLSCKNNQLTSLDVRNGNNINIDHSSYPGFNTENNPNLTCIDVDDVNYSTTNWTDIDSQHYFSTNCPPPSAIQEHSTTKELLKTTDLLGRETKQTNQPLFYIYDDGTVEKQIIIE